MASFPPDRFDGVTEHLDRVGAHRGGRRAHHGLITFAWAALAVGVLVLIGIVLLRVVGDSSSFTDNSSPAASASAGTTSTPSSTTPATTPVTPSTPATPSDAPVTDPSTLDFTVTQIAVLNGTSTSGLAARGAAVLTTGGWKVASTGNAPAQAASSIVYYSASSSANRNIALGIAQKLGFTAVEQSTQFSNAITVVLGADYRG